MVKFKRRGWNYYGIILSPNRVYTFRKGLQPEYFGYYWKKTADGEAGMREKAIVCEMID